LKVVDDVNNNIIVKGNIVKLFLKNGKVCPLYCIHKKGVGLRPGALKSYFHLIRDMLGVDRFCTDMLSDKSRREC